MIVLTETIAAALRSDLLTATATIATALRSCPVRELATVANIVDLLGADSLLVLDVAMADATQRVGELAVVLPLSSRRRREHMTRFEALCNAHDLVLARQAVAA